MDPRYTEFLGELERAEAALLTWGLVDGFLAAEEVRTRVTSFLDRRGAWSDFADEDAFTEEMVSRRLLFRWFDGGYRFRTRMAETVRLMARLRQLFPRHFNSPGGWVSSPTLVADFRFLLRAREYPKRNYAAREAIDREFAGSTRLSSLQVQVLQKLLGVDEASDGVPLAGFQVRATVRILSQAGNGAAGGTMVCAGTGSGKTWAFYLPAITRLAGMIEKDSSRWTRALAIYPRNELLKDQLTETVRQAQRLKPVLRAARVRPIQVGTFFGPTPKSAGEVVDPPFGKPWERQDFGRVCPFLVCPSCSGPMVWRDVDREQGIERLVCNRGDPALEPDDIVLTRARITREPADVLFTTTEMMNQRMTDSRTWHLFGIGEPSHRRPVLVLLDEAHTYAGTHGAQVAYLLRRWRNRAQTRPHFVGLSATLMEAAAFFAQLTGLPLSAVEEISPERAEMQQDGMEYMLALRGDPVSGASVLSTTIQTTMLLRRVLDAADGISEGTNGQKVFVFTDDLDVTNRMFFNLLDAEGMDSNGRPDPRRHPGGSLAALRATTLADEGRRFMHGQSWRLCEDIGHQLGPGAYLRVGRVSSQDSGVDAAADVIVATASLEVGFNDPDVGAILQHKAPRDPASFLQRKGRAGRNRLMRPWTVVVLSDFGRDRLAYQGYDLLFDPELRPRDLPIANRHVQKMQAAYACLDWLGAELTDVGGGWFWRDASEPGGDFETVRRRQTAAAELLGRVLAGGEEADRLREWLTYSLKLGEDEIQALLWESPRALMTATLPTLQRRLATQWMFRDQIGGDFFRKHHPLPEFVPASLFSDLTLPEVQVWAILGPNRDPEAFEMPVLNALREFAPGRISRRFGIRHGLSRHWIPVDPTGPSEQMVDVAGFCGESDREFIGDFHYRDASGIRSIPVWRPFAVSVRADAPLAVKDSSQAFLDWHTQLLAPGAVSAGQTVDLPLNSPWTVLLREIRFFTHLQHQPVRVRRFACGACAHLNLNQGQSAVIATRFVLPTEGTTGPSEIALGYAFEADAVRVRLTFPTDWRLADDGTPEKLPALRAARFRWCVRHEPILEQRTSVFERQWLADIVLAAVTANAVQDSLTIQEAWQALRERRATLQLDEVLDVVYQSVPSEADDSATRFEQQRLTDLRALVRDAVVLTALDACVPSLWQPVTPDWHPWLRERFLATAAVAFREAVQQMCPDVDGDALQVDLDCGPDETGAEAAIPGTADFWLSEDTPGGGGIVEHLLPRLAEAPRLFLDLWQSALSESDFEHADHELRRFLTWVVEEQDTAITGELQTIRQASSLEGITNAFRRMQVILQSRGLHTSHSVMTALSSRILRPGSTSRTDGVVAGLMARWLASEQALGVEIEAQAFAYAMSHADALDGALDVAAIPLAIGQDRRTWRFNALAGLLWPRGSLARNHALSVRQPFTDLPESERLLITDVFDLTEPEIEFESAGWVTLCERMLLERERVAVVAKVDSVQALRIELTKLLARPLDTGSLLVYPRLRGIERRRDRIAVILEVVSGGQITAGESQADDTASARLIIKTARGSRDEVRDLLESLFAVELLSPGDELWLVSPWISDLGVLDNRSGGYAGLEPGWPKRHLSLAELFVFALRTNPRARLWIVTRPDEHNLKFCERVLLLATLEGCADRLSIDSGRSVLHIKGLVATSFALNGSMNFTRNGVEVLDETVQLETDPPRVGQFRLNLHGHYG